MLDETWTGKGCWEPRGPRGTVGSFVTVNVNGVRGRGRGDGGRKGPPCHLPGDRAPSLLWGVAGVGSSRTTERPWLCSCAHGRARGGASCRCGCAGGSSFPWTSGPEGGPRPRLFVLCHCPAGLPRVQLVRVASLRPRSRISGSSPGLVTVAKTAKDTHAQTAESGGLFLRLRGRGGEAGRAETAQLRRRFRRDASLSGVPAAVGGDRTSQGRGGGSSWWGGCPRSALSGLR